MNLVDKTYYNLKVNTSFYDNATHIVGKYENNILEYSINEELFKLNLKDKEFTKINEATILKVNSNNCYLKLINMDNGVEIPIDYLEFQINKRQINIEYRLISHEEQIKITIEIGSVSNG